MLSLTSDLWLLTSDSVMFCLAVARRRVDESSFSVYSVRQYLLMIVRLPPAARAALAGHLLDSLDDAVDENVESAWSEEIARRIRELDDGKVKTIPWTVARRQIVGRLLTSDV